MQCKDLREPGSTVHPYCGAVVGSAPGFNRRQPQPAQRCARRSARSRLTPLRFALTLQGAIPREAAVRQPLCADIDGFSLHAAVRVEAYERKRLEQRCRYITRPPLSGERVQLNAAGQVQLKLKTP